MLTWGFLVGCALTGENHAVVLTGLRHFERGNVLLCAVNLTDQPMPLPDVWSPLLASGPLNKDGMLPSDTTVLLLD